MLNRVHNPLFHNLTCKKKLRGYANYDNQKSQVVKSKLPKRKFQVALGRKTVRQLVT